MSGWVAWFVFGLVLLGVELLTGTFYLLVFALAAALAGVAAWFGLPFAAQLAVAAAGGIGGAAAVRRWKQSRADAPQSLQNLDVGQTVHVAAWSAEGSARASYRGAEWDVRLAPGAPATPGEQVIQSIDGSRLIVAPRER